MFNFKILTQRKILLSYKHIFLILFLNEFLVDFFELKFKKKQQINILMRKILSNIKFMILFQHV